MQIIKNFILRAGADFTELEKELQSASKKMKKIGKDLGKVGKTMTASITLPIVAVGAAMLSSAMDLEATEAKYKTVFGDMTDEADDFIKKFKELTPATTASARSMASGIQDLLVPMGFAREEATKMTGETMHLVGALTNFNSATHTAEDVAGAFSAALTGETEPLKRLGIQLSQAAIEAYAVANGFAEANVDIAKLNKTLIDIEIAQTKYNEAVEKYGEESIEARKALAELGLKEQTRDKLMQGSKITLDAQTKAEIILAMAYEQSGDALAAYNEESLDTKTKMGLLKAEAIDVAASFGEHLLPVMNKIVDALRSATEWFGGLTEEQQKTILAIGGVVAAIGPLLIIAGKMATSLSAIMALFSGTAAAAGGASVATAGFGAVMGAALLPVLAVIAAVTALIAVYKNWDSIKDSMGDLIGGNKMNMDIENSHNIPSYQDSIYDGSRMKPVATNANNVTVNVSGNTLLNERDADRIGDAMVKKLRFSGVMP